MFFRLFKRRPGDSRGNVERRNISSRRCARISSRSWERKHNDQISRSVAESPWEDRVDCSYLYRSKSFAFSRHSITKPARYIAPFARSFSSESQRYSASAKRRSATVRICDGRRRGLLKMSEANSIPLQLQFGLGKHRPRTRAGHLRRIPCQIAII